MTAREERVLSGRDYTGRESEQDLRESVALEFDRQENETNWKKWGNQKVIQIDIVGGACVVSFST